MRRSADFFISYTKADVEWARWIAWELQQANYVCIIQDRDFAPGQNFMHLMRHALRDTRHMIAILSPDYFASAYANVELNAALVTDPTGTSAKVIPVRVRNCKLDPILAGRIYIDLVGAKKVDARRRLLTGIHAAISIVTEPASMVFESPPVFPALGKKENDTRDEHLVQRRGRRKPKLVFVGIDVGRGLNLRGQYRQIRAALLEAKSGPQFQVTSHFNPTADDLPDILNQEMPTIFHLSGNQDGGRVLIRDRNAALRRSVTSHWPDCSRTWMEL
jgi:hypothetical protein